MLKVFQDGDIHSKEELAGIKMEVHALRSAPLPCSGLRLVQDLVVPNPTPFKRGFIAKCIAAADEAAKQA